MLVKQVVDSDAELGAAQERRLFDGVVEEQVGDVERIDGYRLVLGAVVVIELADSLVEETDVPVTVEVGDADGFGIMRGGSNPQLSVGVLGGAESSVSVQEDTMADGVIAFQLPTLGVSVGGLSVNGLAGDVWGGRVGVSGYDVVEIGIKGEAVGLKDGSELEGLCLSRLGNERDGAGLDIEDAAGGDDVSGGPLTIDGPVIPEAVTGVEGGLPCAVDGVVRDEVDAAGADAGDDLAADAADGLCIGVLEQVDFVDGELVSPGDGEPLRYAEFILRVGLSGLGDEFFVEVRAEQVDPGAGIGGSLEAVSIRPLIPEAGSEGSVFGGLADGDGVAEFPIAVEFIGGAGGGDAGSVVVLLMVVIAVGVDLFVEMPAGA